MKFYLIKKYFYPILNSKYCGNNRFNNLRNRGLDKTFKVR